jgi:hypothetical protein
MNGAGLVAGGWLGAGFVGGGFEGLWQELLRGVWG